MTLTDSTVSGNSATGVCAGGGGIYALRDVTLTNSTVSGNSTAGRSVVAGSPARRDADQQHGQRQQRGG